MRDKDTPASLGEILGGKHEQGMSLKNLKDVLGEKMPEMEFNNIGRFRLMRALQQRFGTGFRNIHGVKGLIKEFDDEIEYNGTVEKMKLIKPRKANA